MSTHAGADGAVSRLATAFLWAGACVLAMCAASSAEVGRTVYYQITYSDGNIRDESNVPATNKNIRMVLRISRIEPAVISYEVITTHNAPLTKYDTGRTIRTELKWNGKAWVAPAEELRKRMAMEKRRSADARVTRLAETVRTLMQAERKRLALSLRELTSMASDADKKLARAKGTDGEKQVADELSKILAARKRVSERLRQCDHTLVELRSGRGPLARAKGKIVEVASPPVARHKKPGTKGREVQVPPHRVQVWKLPPAKKLGKGRHIYEVRMPHPEAGAYGAFYYVAYADTDGDGEPDKLIARSPLAKTDKPGAWTSWRFETKYADVFVGNAWMNPNTSVYCRPAPANRNNGTSVYVSGLLGAMPYWHGQSGGENGYWPYFGSIQVYVENPSTPTTIKGENRILILDRR